MLMELKHTLKCEIKTCRARVHTVVDGGPSIIIKTFNNY